MINKFIGRFVYRTIVTCIAFSILLYNPACIKDAHAAPKVTTAKNIIILISDGMGYNHVDAASLYQYGTTGTQVYEDFPVTLGMSTYMAGQSYDTEYAWTYFKYVSYTTGEKYTRYTDSAAAATAMSTGIKTYKGSVGLDLDANPVTHLIEKAEKAGKSTGVVTSVHFSNATPAAFVAHNLSRN